MPFSLKSLVTQSSWQTLLQAEWDKPCIQKLENFLTEELAHKTILPPQNQWFNSLNSTPVEQVKVVILGQDPYPTPGHAHGLSFSMLSEQQSPTLPKSLQNIYKELYDDLAIDNFHSSNLQPWADQGVLLLNAVLTLESGLANSHQNKGWESLTDRIIKGISDSQPHCVFILWGKQAQEKQVLINANKHSIIITPHPSPLSAYRGFWGSKPFSKTNLYLSQHQQTPINWQLPINAMGQTSFFLKNTKY